MAAQRLCEIAADLSYPFSCFQAELLAVWELGAGDAVQDLACVPKTLASIPRHCKKSTSELTADWQHLARTRIHTFG